MQIKAMIVDDEYYFREALKKTVPWKELNIEVCAEADNGESAIVLVKQHSPNIILADINMPKMDGLEFIKQVKTFNKEIKIIIISGYDEFDYARQAITLGVQNYLLKPISEDEICQILLHLSNEIIKSQKVQSEDIQYKRKVNKNKTVAKQYYLNRLVQSKNSKENESMRKELIKLNYRLKNANYCAAAVIEIDFNWDISYEDHELWNFTLSNVLTEFLRDTLNYEICLDDNRRTILVCEFIHDKENSFTCQQQQIKEILFYAQGVLKRNFGFSVSVGIGKIYKIEKLYQSYHNGVHVLENREFDETETLEFFEDAAALQFENYYLPPQKKIQLLLYLGEKKKIELINLIKSVFEEMKIKRLTHDTWKIVAIDILTPARRHMEKTISKENMEAFYLFEHVKTKKTIELEDYVISIYEEICDSKNTKEEVKVPDVIQRTLKFIEENYADSELNIDTIAKTVFVNYNYLCVLFKKTMGITINEYILKFRMQKAMTYIGDGVSLVGELSEKSGYANVNYFAKCFKKEFGVPPSKYIASVQN